MTTVWVMLVITVQQNFIGPPDVGGETLSYKNAELCLDDISRVKSKLTKYSQIYIKCSKNKVYVK